MIKKRIVLICIVAVVFVILTCVYFFVLAPMLKNASSSTPPELLEGEDLGTGNTILMFEHTPRENIKQIDVTNEKGSYTFYYDKEEADFILKDYESAPFDKEMLSSLIVATGFPAVMTRVVENADNLAEYGLAEDDNPAYYVLETRDGKKHKVFIGDMIPTGAGYYAKYESRDVVYIVDASISTTLLGSVTNLISPILFIPVTQTNYFTVKDFILSKDGKPFIQLTSETVVEKDETGEKYENLKEYKMLYPSAGYEVSSKYDELLQGFQETNGLAVVEIGKDKDIEKDGKLPNEILEKYNLVSPKYELLFTHSGIQNDILISEKTEEGIYYAYSILFNTIVSFQEDTLAWLEWDLIDYIEKEIFQYNINDIRSISVKADGIDETFYIYTSEGETTTNPVTGATTTAMNLQVKLKSSGEYLPDSENFRKFYMVLLNVKLVKDADVLDEKGLEKLAEITVYTNDNKEIRMAFYPYATRRCFFTLNGKGEFYVLKDAVDKVVRDAKKVLAGESVDYQSKD